MELREVNDRHKLSIADNYHQVCLAILLDLSNEHDKKLDDGFKQWEKKPINREVEFHGIDI